MPAALGVKAPVLLYLEKPPLQTAPVLGLALVCLCNQMEPGSLCH